MNRGGASEIDHEAGSGTVAQQRGSIELRGVTKRFGDAAAVDSVDLEVRSGEFLSILGPSGCGKTTTLRMISGFEVPTQGRVWISGEDATDVPPHKRNVNTVFQSYALFPHLTVAENVAYGLKVKKHDRSSIGPRVARTLEMVQLPQLADRRPHQLSGGQQQRVALARAIINEPDVLLLDEPLSALDLKLRQAMRIELKQLHEQLGITFVFVTHDQAEAITMSDRIAVMNEGRILQLGTAEDVYEHPTSRFVANFIGQTNFLEGRIEALHGVRAEVLLADGSRVEASTEGGGGFGLGDAVTVAIRPERVQIHPGGTERDPVGGGVEGTLTALIYLGDATRASVTLPGGAEIVAVRRNEEESHPFGDIHPGSAVQVSWQPEAARVLVE